VLQELVQTLVSAQENGGGEATPLDNDRKPETRKHCVQYNT